uniref:HintN domain-containing protein n=1 Tax=Steinernema glaseri TaxID=37863 RepID=A0A1I7XX90_9BILA
MSQDRGVAVVNPGQIVIGGEVLHGKRQYAFDYISDILKHTKADGTVTYDVSIRRFPCLPQPDEMSVNVDEVTHDEILRRFAGATKEQLQKPFPGSAVAFQAPIVPGSGGATAQLQTAELVERVVEQPVRVAQEAEVVQGPFVAENDAVIEEITAEEGLELPEGQVPAGLQNQGESVGGGQGGTGQGTGGGQGGNFGGDTGGNFGGQGNNFGGNNFGGQGNNFGGQGNSFVGQPQFQPVQPGYQGGSGGSPGGYYGGGSPGYYGGGGGGYWCFTADTLVEKIDGKKIRMDEITMEDWLLSINGSQAVYSPMDSWVHRMPEAKAQFHRIELDDGKVLKLTAKHYIYKTQCSAPGEVVPFEQISREAVFAEQQISR